MSKSTFSNKNSTLHLARIASLLPLVCFLMFLHSVGQPLFSQESGTTQIYGGNGGRQFSDPVIQTGGRITAVQIRAGDWIDSIQFTYSLPNGTTATSQRHGGSGGRASAFQLAEDEYIVGLSGRYGDYIDSLRIHTNKRTSQLFGGRGGDHDFQISVPAGNQAVGFTGRADEYMDALGLIYVPTQQFQVNQTPLAGGGGGSAFADKEIAQGARISEIRFRAGSLVDGIQAVYTLSDGRVVEGPWHGGKGGKTKTFRLNSDEYVIGLSGRAGDRIDSVRIITNKRTSAVFGGKGGNREYRIDVPSGSRAIGFTGRAGSYLDAIGLTYLSSSAYRPAQRVVWPSRRTNQ